MRKEYTFYVYILSNSGKTCYYVGVTNSLTRRLQEHYENRGKPTTFAGRYHCYELVYFEVHQYILNAIAREKQLKKWSRSKKLALVRSHNPSLVCLNPQFWENDL